MALTSSTLQPLHQKEGRWLMVPWLLIFGLFWLFPITHAAWLSFTDYSPLRDHAAFVGVQNYTHLAHDAEYGKALSNTLFFTFVTLPITTVFALILAQLLFTKPPASGFFETVMLVPVMVSMVVIALLFKYLYLPYGLLHDLFKSLGLKPIMFLSDPHYALPSIMAMDVWSAMGYYALIFLTALKQIPSSLFEAARLEGAGVWLTFRKITLPALLPILFFVLVINSIRSLQLFTEVYVMTPGGGPSNSTLSLVYLMFKKAFEHREMGYASAQAFTLVGLATALSLLQKYLLRDRTTT